MKNFLLFLALFYVTFTYSEEVKLKFFNTNYQGGKIAVAVYDDARYFPDDEAKALYKDYFSVTSKVNFVEAVIKLPPGRYAISAFLDANNNKKLDTGMFGIPQERFGFSNNPSIRTGPPTFNECDIEIKASQHPQDIKINLIKLFQ